MESKYMNLRIKKLDIFILRQFGLLFVGTFFICQFVLMMQFLWRYVDELIGKGLSLEVMAQFFWYMGLMLVPQALPLAILLSSLITFGNLGESSELTAIKAAGISLMQTFRSLIVVTIVICLCSFYFQNNIGPQANMKLTQLLVSMKQKSPELEIPEGVFYDGIPNCNIYVQKKDMKTGHLYGIMIYRMTQSYEDAAIILADSGMLQSTADKKHLLLSLWQGEWFENMQSQQFAGSAAVPYRRETFIAKQIILDFDAGFNMADAAMLSNNAKGKSLDQINHAIDSITHVNDSLGSVFYDEAKRSYYAMPHLSKADSARAVKRGRTPAYNIDKRWERLKVDQKRQIITDALGNVQNQVSELDFKSMLTKDNEWIIRMHYIEAINKFTLAFQCLIFFFIGASLGAIIRKGGLGVPVIVSVLVFIVYYILDNSGYRMARIGDWSVWFGKLLAPATLTPVAIFVTYKAYNDSMVFNADLWVSMFRRLLGLRAKRHIAAKEVIITQPHYEQVRATLRDISHDITAYAQKHNLISPPNIINVFFRYQPDHEIARINALLEQTIDDLANTRDMQVLHLINQYPILSVKAHTRPFERKWLNILMAIVAPLGLFLYIRMWRYRLRLLRDLRAIRENTQRLTSYIEKNIISKTQIPHNLYST